jgi:hypothetical protein
VKDYSSPYQQFLFVGWEQSENQIIFRWSFDGELNFHEILEWPEGTELPNSKAFNNAAELYLLLAGASYYKCFPAKELVYEGINSNQAEFIESAYKMGLGEYLYVNQLNPDVIGKFVDVSDSAEPNPEVLDLANALVLVGGGKDSLVSTDLLKKAGKNFTSFRVNSKEWVDGQLEKIGAPVSTIKRTLDPNLMQLMGQGALNGHVPVTAILSAAAIMDAIRLGLADVITSNEASANIPNTEYCGMEINHQFSKSLELETAFANYVHEFISPSLNYFSLLRPWTEMKIVEYFVENLFDEYSGMWSSSNHNFRLGADTSKAEWDPNFSEKTLSIFGMFAAFVEPEKLIKEMGGDYFESAEYAKIWDELVGNIGIKPLECVADIEEMKLAVSMALENGWVNAGKIEVGAPEYDYKTNREHRIPEAYERIVQ